MRLALLAASKIGKSSHVYGRGDDGAAGLRRLLLLRCRHPESSACGRCFAGIGAKGKGWKRTNKPTRPVTATRGLRGPRAASSLPACDRFHVRTLNCFGCCTSLPTERRSRSFQALGEEVDVDLRFTAGVGVRSSCACGLRLVWRGRKPLPCALKSSATPARVGHAADMKPHFGGVAVSTTAFTLVCFNAQTLLFSVSHLCCSVWPCSNEPACRTSGALPMSRTCSRVLSRSSRMSHRHRICSRQAFTEPKQLAHPPTWSIHA